MRSTGVRSGDRRSGGGVRESGASRPGIPEARHAGAPGRDWAPLVLFAVACAERLAFLLGGKDRTWPFTVFYEGDAEHFYAYAQAILRGGSYDNGIPFHPPLFPLILSLIHAVSGDPVRHLLARSILGVASALFAPMLYLFARDSLGRSAALAAGLLAALSFGLDALGTSATSEGVYLLLLLGLLLLARGIPAGGRAASLRGAAIGAGTGLLSLARAEGAAVGLPLLAIWLGGLTRSEPRRALRLAFAAAAGFILVLAPWTIRNAVRLSEWNRTVGRSIDVRLPTFVPLTAYGPLNFALANNDLATGGFQRAILTSRSGAPVLDLADPQHSHYFLRGTGEGIGWIASHPGRFVRLCLVKVEIASRALDLGWLPWNVPMGRSGTRLPVDLFAPRGTGLRYVQLGLCAWGLLLLLRRGGSRKSVLLLALPPLAVLLTTLLSFGYVRFGMIAAAFLFAFEGVALAWIAGKAPERIRSLARRTPVWGALLALLLATLIYGAAQSRDYRASGTTDAPGGKLLRDAPIQIEPLGR